MLQFLRYPLRHPDDDEGAAATPDTAGTDGDPDAPESLEDAVLSQLGIQEPGEGETAGKAEDDGAAPGPESPGKAAAAADVSGATTTQESAAGTPEQKDPDAELLAPLPETVKAETRARFDTLAESYRTLREQARTDRQNLEALTGVIRETGATNDEFAASLNYMRMIHSDDLRSLEQARQMLVQELRGLDSRLGRAPEADDEADALLARHTDLAQAVEAMDMSREAAVRYAAEREASQRRLDDHRRRTQGEEHDRAHLEAVTQASRQVSAFEADLRAKDPNYARIAPAMRTRAAEIARHYPPTEWRAHLEAAYQELRGLIGDPAPAPTSRDPQPLRPGQAGHTVQEPPKTMEEAVFQKLGIE